METECDQGKRGNSVRSGETWKLSVIRGNVETECDQGKLSVIRGNLETECDQGERGN